MPIADLHIHSRFSRATSQDCDAPHLDLWARKKGLALIGTGDFTHAAWREELKNQLERTAGGLYQLKSSFRLPDDTLDAETPRFVLSGEISTIYKKGDKTRKVHHLILLPDLETAEELSRRLEAIGNLHADGRPILGLDSRDLMEITLECCPDAVLIPAHIWTPHFSLFGAFSQFSTVEECYGDLTPFIHAMETGLSSDPPMNRRLSQLDDYQLISNSDAHSPRKLGREATLIKEADSFQALKTAVETGEGLLGTLEFFPEEGKYHLDGHRACRCCLTPEQTAAAGGKCPICGKKVTVGVMHRVQELADRSAPPALPKPFESLMPLPEVLGEALGMSPESKKTQALYAEALRTLGPEFRILRQTPMEDVRHVLGPMTEEALRRLRRGEARKTAGYDGVYGKIFLFSPGEREALAGQTSLLPAFAPKAAAQAPAIAPAQAAEPAISAASAPADPLNAEQAQAAHSLHRVTAVIAGPGTGKTKTLIARIAWLIEEKYVPPDEITALTFTRQAAREIQARLEERLGKKRLKGLTVGTFHSVFLDLLEKKPLLSRREQEKILSEILRERGIKAAPRDMAALISRRKNGLREPELPEGVYGAYEEALRRLNARDLDGILQEALALPAGKKQFRHLLVDEYQDVNGPQRHLIRHLAEGGDVFLIGDPDQSIYGFRGASAACFDEFLSGRQDALCVRLTQNYRSSPQILDCALAVIGHNPGEKRVLAPALPGGAPVRLVQCGDGEQEARRVAREIIRLTGGLDMLSAREGERGGGARAFSEIAVLCRTHHQLEKIENALKRESIPCLVSMTRDEMEEERIQGLLDFFRAFLEGSASALDNALRTLFHCGDALCAQAAAALEKGLLTPDGVREVLSPFDGLSPFAEAAEDLLPRLEKEKPRRLLEALAKTAGCKGRGVKALLDAAVFAPSLPALIEDWQLGEEGDTRRLTAGKPAGAVRLMTLHASKGLEFPVVLLPGLTENEFPLPKAVAEGSLEEERRLFFVGITRAREELVLLCGGAPSPFLRELPAGIIREKEAPRMIARQISFF